MSRWTPLEPRYPWEVPVSAVSLISGALAVARPGGREGPRFNGEPDDVVADLYARLREAVTACAERHGGDVARVEQLEGLPPGTSSSRWETWVATSGVADDPAMVDRARAVWLALGEAEYHRQFKARPRTWRGFQALRAWGAAAAVPAGLIVGGGADSGLSAWLVLAGAVGWVLLVALLFGRSYRRRARMPWAELPHL
ncbi:MAG: hypothetical protein U0Q15_06850 [Kineosporiaceae bacterium]